MKVKDIIEQLQQFDPETLCVVYADHGQTYIKAGDVASAQIPSHHKDAYYFDPVHVDDAGDWVGDLIEICVIGD